MNQLLILLCICFGVEGLKVNSNVTLGSLPAKERNRRLIPYMTFYLGQPQNAQYRQVMAVPYIAVPQYRPVPQRYIQQPTPLTRMITQNYLNLAKQLQDNPRYQVNINSNYQPETKYYTPIHNQEHNVPEGVRLQYAKPQTILQYTNTQAQEQYTKQEENAYEQTEEDPRDNVRYAKPSPDALLHYMKPEVQQYVTQANSHNIQYSNQEQDGYNDADQQRIPAQYLQQYATNAEYTNNLDLRQNLHKTKAENTGSLYVRKPLLQYAPKITITPSKLAPQPADYPEYITRTIQPNLHSHDDDTSRRTPSKLVPQPADVPEYITRPIHKPNLPSKVQKASVTIMQSQEIDVDDLASTAVPPKYHATYVAKPQNYPSYPIDNTQESEELDPELVEKNFNDILQGVSLSKSLPERITTENLDYSIKTLSKILRILQRAHTLPQSAKHIVKGFPKPVEALNKTPKLKLKPHQQYSDGSTPGRPHIDYPAYDEIPQTNFNCKDQRYKGFFGDPETRCQVWHYCDLNGGQASFLCPNGTIFSQVALTCDWWFNVKCASTAQLYVLNERLYKYILPQKPSFPEDYSGPLVDHYLSLKFKEIEEKNKNKTEEHKEEKEEDEEPPFSIDEATQNKVRSAR